MSLIQSLLSLNIAVFLFHLVDDHEEKEINVHLEVLCLFVCSLVVDRHDLVENDGARPSTAAPGTVDGRAVTDDRSHGGDEHFAVAVAIAIAKEHG